MKTITKKELILNGLDCGNCANKILADTENIDGIIDPTLSFVTKTLKFGVDEDYKFNNVIEEIKDIVKKYEPDVVVEEKKPSMSSSFVLRLNGLSCTSCALKIEKEIFVEEGVASAHLDFATGKLIINLNGDKSIEDITKKAYEIIKSHEPQIEIINENNRNRAIDKENRVYDKELIMLITSIGVFFLALVLKGYTTVQLSLFVISYLLSGGKILKKAINNISHGEIFDENFLMSIATIGAFIIGEYAEGVAVMLFFQVGEYLQGVAVNRSRKSITALMDIRPDFANIRRGNDIVRVAPEEVNVGDIIILKPGERVPLDGSVIKGESALDTSAMTGESIPRQVIEGDEVLSGFINSYGVLEIKVEKSYQDSTVTKILELVENASSKKSPTENFITKFARYYTPVVVVIALMLATIPPLIINDATFSQWTYRALVFLIISCPCALVVSIPLGFFGGIGGASKNGILVKGGNYLEALNNIDTVVFDKTGTLTKGIFKVTEIINLPSYSKEEILELAAYGEAYSNHPIAKSIVKEYGKDINKEEIEEYKEIHGQGITAIIKGRKLVLGNASLMLKKEIQVAEVRNSGTAIHVAIDGAYGGYILIADELKGDAKEAIIGLKQLGINKTIMLTGDSREVAEAISNSVGIDKAYWQLLPHEKVEKVEELVNNKTTRGKVIFVGDGTNDAPVLARADVGVAMGGLGSDAAIEAADIVIMNDEPSKLISAIKIAKRTRKIVLQNIVLSLGIKGVFLILGALGIAQLWEAVFADVGVTLLAVLNSMRAMKTNI